MSDKGEISTAIDRMLNVVIPLGTVAFGLLGLLGVPAMIVLYSTAFTDGAALFPYILSADLMLVFVWVVGSPLLAAGDLVLWLALDLLLAINRWAVGLLLLPHFGVLAVPIGLLVAAMLHLALTFMVFRIRYELRLAAKQIYRLLGGIVFVVSLSVIGAYSRQSVPVMSTAALAWLSYVIYWGWQNDFIFKRFLRK
jgi:O-antigen/teichoic acid export membrane protein